MDELLTAAGLILTVLLAYMQIQRTFASTIKTQETHLRNELKVRIYEQAATVFREAANLVSEVDSHYRTAISILEMQVKGFPVTHVRTAQQLIDAQSAASRGITRVLLMLEQYEIAFARFRTIRREFSEAHQEFLRTQQGLWAKLISMIPPPPDATGRNVRPLVQPTNSNLPEILSLLAPYAKICSDLQCYLIDAQVEAQNELLGTLFERQLPPRHPLDGSRVLTRDAGEVLERPPGSLV